MHGVLRFSTRMDTLHRKKPCEEANEQNPYAISNDPILLIYYRRCLVHCISGNATILVLVKISVNNNIDRNQVSSTINLSIFSLYSSTTYDIHSLPHTHHGFSLRHTYLPYCLCVVGACSKIDIHPFYKG